jgi:hypothetical protein
VQRGVHPAAVARDPIDKVVAVPVRAVRVHELAVDDHVDAGIEHPLDARARGGVRGDEPSAVVGFLDDRPQLVGRERGPQRVGRARGAAGGRDLDPVGPVGDQHAGRLAHSLHPVRRLAEEVQMTAGRRDRAPADHHARARDDVAADAVADVEADSALGAVLARGRDAVVQHPPHVCHGDHQERRLVHRRDALARRAVPGRHNVRVRVHVAREQRAAVVPRLLDRRPLGGSKLGRRPDADDPLAGDQHGSVLDRRPAGAVDHAVGDEQSEVRCAGGRHR